MTGVNNSSSVSLLRAIAITRFKQEKMESIYIGNQSYECVLCAKIFMKESELNIHQRSHRQEKLYECDLCQYSTTRYNHVLKHNLTHTDEKPYQCNVCSKSYKSAEQLKGHKFTHQDISESEQVFDCTIGQL